MVYCMKVDIEIKNSFTRNDLLKENNTEHFIGKL